MTNYARHPRNFLLALLVGGFGGALGCDDSTNDSTGGGGQTTGVATAQGGSGPGSTAGQFMNGTGGAPPACVNLECQQVACSGDVTTTVTGTVFDPSGTLPLYNVVVYVPNSEVQPVADGLSCDQCDAQLSGDPLVSAITDTQGRFTLENVPVGANIPLVMQVGKWRRVITIPTVAECVENPMTDPQVTRLPKSSAEGNIPKIALSTGSADPLFCLLRRLGLDDSEYGVAGSAARIHFYRGANGSTAYDGGFGSSPGASFPNAQQTLWTDGWSDYDIVMLSCEGGENPTEKNGHRAALRDYIDVGGRVFATHYHYNWFQGDAPADLQSVATFQTDQDSFNDDVDIDQTFPKGLALAEWLDFVDGSSAFGQFFVQDGRRHNQFVDTNLARIWVRYMADTIYFSFNAPIGVPEEMQCGRMVFSDIHVSAGAGDPNGTFPSACNNDPLTEQEKVLLFMLFDLSACLVPDDDPPCPPGQDPCGDPDDPVCNGSCVNGCCQEIPE
jgi:hypothetical protein